jgi:hypothetical protein
MYRISRLMWFMSRDHPLIQVPFGLKGIGYGVVADTYIREVIGPGPGQAVPGLPVAGIITRAAMHGIEVIGDKLSWHFSVCNLQMKPA